MNFNDRIQRPNECYMHGCSNKRTSWSYFCQECHSALRASTVDASHASPDDRSAELPTKVVAEQVWVGN